MSTRDEDATPVGDADEATAVSTSTTDEPEAKAKLDLSVEITDSGPCKKHLKVAIAPSDIKRQFEESLGSVKREAAVPGFRPGRAPKTLIQKRFRKEVEGQVKSTLLMAALEQVDEEYKLNPISQPQLDVEAIAIPDDGPMQFEMDVEVQPDFSLPNYSGLTVKRYKAEITDVAVEAQVKSFLERYAQLVPKLGAAAEIGDYVTADLRFHMGGIVLNEVKEIQFRLQPELRFQDGRVPDLAGALVGAKPGDVRDADAEVGMSSPDPALRGKDIRVTFTIHDLKTLRMPEVNQAFLHGIGFDSMDELKDALKEVLERRHAYQRREAQRREILDQLVSQVPFDLPSDLVARQEKTTIRNQVAQMRQSGLSDAQIRAREAEIRANAHASTLRSLQEFFILAKIAEAEGIKVEDDDLDAEVESIAARTDETARRVRARIEKEGLADAVASQILERKAIDRILESVKYEDAVLAEEKDVATLEQTAAAASASDESEAGGEASSTEPSEEDAASTE
jgi:trigger factor